MVYYNIFGIFIIRGGGGFIVRGRGLLGPDPKYDFRSSLPLSGSMLGILYTFWGMGFLIFMQKGSFFSLNPNPKPLTLNPMG